MKKWLWRLLGTDAEAIVLHFASGPEERVRAMYEEIRKLEPEREHLVVCRGSAIGGLPCLVVSGYWDLWRQLGRKRVGLAPFLISGHPLARLAFLTAPGRLLAFNARGERHHLRASTDIASRSPGRG